MTWRILIETLTRAFVNLLAAVSPQIRDAFREFLKGLYVKAKQTENPWDDLFVEVIATVMKIDLD